MKTRTLCSIIKPRNNQVQFYSYGQYYWWFTISLPIRNFFQPFFPFQTLNHSECLLSVTPIQVIKKLRENVWFTKIREIKYHFHEKLALNVHSSFKRPHNHFLEMTLKIFEKKLQNKVFNFFFYFFSSNNHCVLLQTFMNSSFLAFSKFANPVTICISNGFIQLHTL